jgi:hypothetical protein
MTMFTTLPRYKQNLSITDTNVYSYHTKVADIDHVNKTVTPLGWWSVTTSKHINYVAGHFSYTVKEQK